MKNEAFLMVIYMVILRIGYRNSGLISFCYPINEALREYKMIFILETRSALSCSIPTAS